MAISRGLANAEISITVARSTTVREQIMPSERQNMSEQDISIKAREHELYVPVLPDAPPVKPFPVYLRETPGEPLSLGTKLVLAIAGIIVAALFVAAVWRVTHPRATKPKARAARAAAKTAILVNPRAPAEMSPAVPFNARSIGMLPTASLWPRDAFPIPVSYGLYIDTESRR
jgi:hypothetical protein